LRSLRLAQPALEIYKWTSTP